MALQKCFGITTLLFAEYHYIFRTMTDISIDFNHYYPTPHVIQTYLEILGVFETFTKKISESLEPSTIEESSLGTGKFSSEII